MQQGGPESTALGEVDPEFLVCAPEIYIFYACLAVVKQMSALEHALQSGEIDKPAFFDRISPLLTELWGLAEATHRFGIVVPFTPQTAFSPFFWRWFNWWFDYRQGLTPEQLDHIQQLYREYDPALIDYRPVGDWLRHLQTPPFGFEMSPSHSVEVESY